MTEADLYAFMVRHRLGVLGTTGHAGAPQSALMGIATTPQLEIIFDTVKSLGIPAKLNAGSEGKPNGIPG